jgi:hypothetical protein
MIYVILLVVFLEWVFSFAGPPARAGILLLCFCNKYYRIIFYHIFEFGVPGRFYQPKMIEDTKSNFF